MVTKCKHQFVSEANGYLYCGNPKTRKELGYHPYCVLGGSKVLDFQCPLNITSCIQQDMVKCPTCKIEYKGHRKGSYSPTLKSVYERSGAKGLFVKIGYRCPNCRRYFDLEI